MYMAPYSSPFLYHQSMWDNFDEEHRCHDTIIVMKQKLRKTDEAFTLRPQHLLSFVNLRQTFTDTF